MSAAQHQQAKGRGCRAQPRQDQFGVTMHLTKKTVNGCLTKKHETILKSVLNGHNFSREPFFVRAKAWLTYACLGVSLHLSTDGVGTLLRPSRHPGHSRFEFRVSWLSHRLWRLYAEGGVLNG